MIHLSCTQDDLTYAYTRYVEPFVSGAVSTSCSQCHLTGIDITMYAQDTPCETFACMIDAGTVNLDDPAGSVLLGQIAMGDPDSSVFDVSQEHAAMLEWIQWSAKCHTEVCGEVESPCTSGTGAASTGISPIGDCSEGELEAVFWDAVIIDRARCNVCHSEWAQEAGTFGACSTDEDCEHNQECLEDLCRKPGPYYAPNFFEGGEGEMSWAVEADRQLGLNTMYNVLALGFVDVDSPLDSSLLTKPLLEDFQPEAIYGHEAIYGPSVTIESVAEGTGVGTYHGGSSKFNFGCMEPPCLESGVVDCRTSHECHADGECEGATTCSNGYCRIAGSVCDKTYTNYVQFVQYYAECATSPE